MAGQGEICGDVKKQQIISQLVAARYTNIVKHFEMSYTNSLDK